MSKIRIDSPTDVSDSKFLSQLGMGDHEALATVFDKYRPALLQFTRKRLPFDLRRTAEPEDYVQIVFASFCAYLQNNTAHFTTSTDVWKLLTTIALNAIREGVRQVSRSEHFEGLDSHEAVDKRADPTAEVACNDLLATATATMNERQREIVRLRTHQYTIEELALITPHSSPRGIKRLFAGLRATLSRLL